MREWKKIFLEDRYKKKGGVVIHILDKTEFKTKSATKDKQHYIMTKGSIEELIYVHQHIYT